MELDLSNQYLSYTDDGIIETMNPESVSFSESRKPRLRYGRK